MDPTVEEELVLGGSSAQLTDRGISKGRRRALQMAKQRHLRELRRWRLAQWRLRNKLKNSQANARLDKWTKIKKQVARSMARQAREEAARKRAARQIKARIARARARNRRKAKAEEDRLQRKR